jgi:hypothetical protein
VRGIPLISFVALGLLAASGCDNPNSSNYDPMGDAADVAGMALTDVPLDQIASCVESTKAEAYLGDPVAQRRWTAAGQSDDTLTRVCTEIGRNDPNALADMQQEWIADQAVLHPSP